MIDRFLDFVLGPAAGPLKRVAQAPAFAGYLAPRAVTSWLRGLGDGYGGELPGTQVHLQLRCSGALWSGSVASGDFRYQFDQADERHVVSVLVAAMVGALPDSTARGVDLVRLGKTVDAAVLMTRSDLFGVSGASTGAPAGSAGRVPGAVKRRKERRAYLDSKKTSLGQLNFATCRTCGFSRGMDDLGCLCDAVSELQAEV